MVNRPTGATAATSLNGRAMSDDDNRSLRDRIYDSLQDYWPLEMDSIQRAQVRHCRDQIVAEVKDWLAIE
jgi:hypothetical protein